MGVQVTLRCQQLSNHPPVSPQTAAPCCRHPPTAGWRSVPGARTHEQVGWKTQALLVLMLLLMLVLVMMLRLLLLQMALVQQASLLVVLQLLFLVLLPAQCARGREDQAAVTAPQQLRAQQHLHPQAKQPLPASLCPQSSLL